MELYNNEKVLITFNTHRKLDFTSQGTNMVANCLIGHSKSSGVVPDLYTLILTETTFFAEYSRKSLHGTKPKKVTKLNIPVEDIVDIKIVEKSGDKSLYIKSDWGKEYLFELGNSEKFELANQMINILKK